MRCRSKHIFHASCPSSADISEENGSNDDPKLAHGRGAAMRIWGIGTCNAEDRAFGAQSFAEVLWKSGRMIGPDSDLGP